MLLVIVATFGHWLVSGFVLNLAGIHGEAVIVGSTSTGT